MMKNLVSPYYEVELVLDGTTPSDFGHPIPVNESDLDGIVGAYNDYMNEEGLGMQSECKGKENLTYPSRLDHVLFYAEQQILSNQERYAGLVPLMKKIGDVE